MRILLIGQNGQVAHELERTLSCLGEVLTRSRNSEPVLDLLDPGSIHSAIGDVAPDLIINAAAYTQVDRAETEPDAAFTVNAESVGLIAETARKHRVPLIHYSTDYVFSGSASRPYQEDDPIGPVGVYARSKCQGEALIRDAGIPHWILRTSWVYGLHGQNFLGTMLRLMAERETLGIVDDQIGSPTWSRMIAEATALMISRSMQDGRLHLEPSSGTYHLTAAGQTSWFGFAETIRALGIQEGYLTETAATLRPISTAEYPTPAKRPAYSVLDNQRLKQAFDIQIPDWKKGLSLCLQKSAA